MRSKFFLASILLTPILVVVFSTLYFTTGMSPEGTKNNGEFFKSYFNFEYRKNIPTPIELTDFEKISLERPKNHQNFWLHLTAISPYDRITLEA